MTDKVKQRKVGEPPKGFMKVFGPKKKPMFIPKGEAHRNPADTVEQEIIRKIRERGNKKSTKGYGAARTKGMGLQDEKLKPGKVTKAFAGALALGLSAKDRIEGKKKTAPVAMGGIGAAMVKEKAIRKILGRDKGSPKSGEKGFKHKGTLQEIEKKTFGKKKKRYDERDAITDAHHPAVAKELKKKGLNSKKVQEDILKEKMKSYNTGGMNEATDYKKYLKGLKKAEGAVFRAKYKAKQLATAGGQAALRAAKASKYGKIALGVAAAGLTAKEYLKRKMKKNEKKPQKKMGGGAVKKYSQGMSYQDMIPYGGKFVKIKKEMRDKATKNVKQLTTSDAAYSPERRYAALTQKTPSGGKRYVKPITDWDNKQDVIAGMKDRLAGTQYGQGNWRAQVLTPSEAEEQRLIPRQKRISGRRPAQVAGKNYPQRLKKKQPPRSRRELVRPKNVLGRMGGGMMQRPNPVGYSKGTMVKAKGCKLGRTKPTKLY